MKFMQIISVLACFISLATPSFAQQGTIDSTYSADGWHSFLQGNATRMLNDVVIQPDTKAVVVGTFRNSANQNFPFLGRLTSNGALDSTFSGDGLQIDSNAVVEVEVNAVARQSGGKFVVGGDGGDNSPLYNCPSVFTLLRYLPNGNRDSTFGINGMVQTYHANGVGHLKDLIVLSDNKIIAVGGFGATENNLSFMVVKYLPDGSLDSTFGINGIQILIIGSQESDMALSVMDYSYGVTLISGYTTSGGIRNGIIVRLLANGSFDTSFGSGDGSFVFSYSGWNIELRSVGVGYNQTPFCVGTTDGAFSEEVFLHLNSDGTVNPFFACNPVILFRMINNPGGRSYVRKHIMQPNLKFVAAGFYVDSFGVRGVVQRFNEYAQYEPLFNGVGYNTLSVSGEEVRFLNMAGQPDGKILVAGYLQDSLGRQQYLVARYHDNFIATAVPEDPISSILELYPNPADDFVNVRFPSSFGKLAVYNLAGQELLSHQAESTETTMQVSAFPRGIYWVLWTGEDGQTIGKKLSVR
ncbi:MAG: T9SS type A sorting domain-containing protein [Bacteroidetes bacterium]|nr:T9SS type A sorting domain-containing protein [Bacteroidota bacterium]